MPIGKIVESGRNDAWISDFAVYLKANLKPYLKDLEQHLSIMITASYIVGVALIIIRQHLVGLPFSVSNILQAAVVAVYFLGLTIYLLYINYVITRLMMAKVNIENRKTYILIKIALVAILFLALFVLFGDTLAAALLSFIYLCCITKLPKWAPFEVSIALMVGLNIIAIFYIPSDMGGLRSQTVYFCENSAQEKCGEYEYYGVADGLYQLENETGIYLIPIDQGYIQYNKVQK